MKAIANLNTPISTQDEQLILTTLNAVMDIRTRDLDIGNGVLFFEYQTRSALDMAERKLSEIGHPIISYSYPERKPLNFSGSDLDHSSWA